MPLYIVYINREPNGRAMLRSVRLGQSNERDAWDMLPSTAEHATVIEAQNAKAAAQLSGFPVTHSA